jgi:hypothetical protein
MYYISNFLISWIVFSLYFMASYFIWSIFKEWIHGWSSTPKCWLASLDSWGLQLFASDSLAQFTNNTRMTKLQTKFQVMIIMNVPFMIHWWHWSRNVMKHVNTYANKTKKVTMKNFVHWNHITLQVKFKKQFICNCYAIIPWVLQLLCNYHFRNVVN